MTRQQRRQLEREQGKSVLTTDEMNSVKRAYAIFLKVLEKALPNAGISKAKTDKIVQEMHYSMAEMEGKPLPRNSELEIHDSTFKKTLRMSNIERQEFMQLNLSLACVISAADVLTEKGICTKEEKTWLKTAHTWLEKAVVGITSRLAQDELKRQKEFVNNNEFAMFDKAKDRDLIAKEVAEGERVYMAKDQFYEFADRAIMANCLDCKKDYPECELYRIQWEMEVEPLNKYEDGCPYKYTE